MTEQTTETNKAERDSLLRKAYGKATQDLRDKFRTEFEGYYSARAAELGVEWKPRPSAEQKAEEEFEALLKRFPDLAKKVTGDEVQS